MRFPLVVCLFVCLAASTLPLRAQSPNGNINGLISDSSSALVVGADIVAENYATGIQFATKTNIEGIYVLPNLPPGLYRIQVSKVGFKTLVKPDVVVNVQDSLSINFTLLVGAFHDTITVEAGAPLVNTDSATVSTVVDRQFAENLPMNGRSFQTLIYLTPGVVAATTNSQDDGQFSVNGQRPSSNYWMVDGVSANIGVGVSAGGPGNGVGGTLGSFSALGGTNSLVSVDAMQEFRIQTSTFAPEFGRTPGAQISIITRSGTNQFHGTLFDYLRNDVLDASNWFNGYTNQPALPKAKERQNDFGGTISGPIFKDNTFFFFSYEGLRLRLPQTTLTSVPDVAARQIASPLMQPYLNAFPLPNGPDDTSTGIAQFNSSYSNPATLDAYSLRLDHRLTSSWNLFARYSYSPSQFVDRGGNEGSGALSVLQPNRITTQTTTLGAVWSVSPALTNDARLNYSRTNATSSYSMDDFGGAIALTALPFPSPYTNENGEFEASIFSLGTSSFLLSGQVGENVQRQFNFVDNLSWQKGTHSLKFGVDFRRLSPSVDPAQYTQFAGLNDVPSAESGSNAFGIVYARNDATLLFRNLALFAQDTWHVLPRLTVTYGLRWDVDFPPAALNGPSIPAVVGYSLTDLSQLALAEPGTAPFKTTYGNIAPRIGFAYQLAQPQNRQTVLRGGFGVFYDLVSSETGNLLGRSYPPFGNFNFFAAVPFPFTAGEVAAPTIPATGTLANIYAFNPNLKLPYSLQWNLALQQSLGKDQTLSTSYIGAIGRRALQTTYFLDPTTNTNISNALFIDNTATSDYNALQVQFQRRLSRGVQALAGYTWSHSIDNASAGSIGSLSNAGAPGSGDINRGNSDFDIRNAMTAGVTFDVPDIRGSAFGNAILRGWSTENFILARSAPPVDLVDAEFNVLNSVDYTNVRPDLVPGQPVYLYGRTCGLFFSLATCPGAKGLNPAAFANPPVDPNTGNPLRQGNLPRNALRAFGATQWDFAVHRDFPIRDRAKLQFRAEMFNVLNHPNFGPPNNLFGGAGFGLSNQMLAQSLAGAGTLGAGGFSSLYQIGGPRSIQFALKLLF